MKKKIIFGLIFGVLAWAACGFSSQAKVPKYRQMQGTYYNYMCIVTKDGHEWLLSDKQSKSNPYMKRVVRLYNGRRKVVYVPVFKPGQKVKVTFNTKGTRNVRDDVIVKVR